MASTETRDYLLRQLDIAWQLTWYHLESLGTDECLWRPAPRGLHLEKRADGSWSAGWPDREGYDIGPPSVGWLTWHLEFWWSMAVDHAFGEATLTREQIPWPGSAEASRERIKGLHDRWKSEIEKLDDEALRSSRRTRWPFQERPFGDVVAWANVELTKNASEIGYGRFLYGVRDVAK